MDFSDEFLDAENIDYEIYQLRKVMKFIVDDIYTGIYTPKQLCVTIPLVMGLAETIYELQSGD